LNTSFFGQKEKREGNMGKNGKGNERIYKIKKHYDTCPNGYRKLD